MYAMRRRSLLVPLAILTGLAGCGGSETTTETVTVTRTATVTVAQTTPQATTAQPPAAAPTGLGEDQIALIGTFDMKVTDTDPAGVNASGSSVGREEEWRLRTTCDGDDCGVQLRRRVPSGGLQIVELEPKDDAPDEWYGEFRSTATCGPREIRGDANLTLRGLQATDRVATKLEAFWRAEDIECVNDTGGTARYTGTLR
jgi:hypothetical protein